MNSIARKRLTKTLSSLFATEGQVGKTTSVRKYKHMAFTQDTQGNPNDTVFSKTYAHRPLIGVLTESRILELLRLHKTPACGSVDAYFCSSVSCSRVRGGDRNSSPSGNFLERS